MIATERRRYILNSLNRKGCISLKDIAKELDVSEITIRRDLEKLEAEGKLQRVQGGAATPDYPEGAELATSQKIPINSKEKSIVATYAASQVQEGDCVYVDTGTSMLPLIMQISQKQIQIITNNTLFVNTIKNCSAKIYLVGGEYVPHFNMNVGPLALEMLGQFYFDKAFISCSGYDALSRTVYDTTPEGMVIKQKAMELSTKKYLLLDSSKFEKKGFLQLCSSDVFDAVFCNAFELAGPAPSNLKMV